MAPNLSTPNTSPMPNQPGRWVVTKFGPPSVLNWQTFDPLAELTGDNVLVRILVGGIAGVDNLQRAGGYPDPGASKPGFTTGYDFVGEVIALGDSVPKDSNLAIGDRVVSLCKYGAHATHVVLPYIKLMRIERTDDPLKICALPLNYMTAWGMLKHSGVDLRPGSSILIGSASGGVGTAMAQLINAFDMGIQMIGTASAHKSDYLRSLGIEPIDRNASDLVEQVRKLTGGTGVDVAYDMVCSEDSIEKSLAATKADIGKVVVIGIMGEIASDGSGMLKNAEELKGEITSDGSDMLKKARAIMTDRLQSPRASFWALDVEFYEKPEIAEFYGIVEKVRSGRLDPVVAKLLPLSKAVEAHEMLIDGSAIKGKMLFVVDEELATKYGI
ncbi:hypothetical protein NX059_003695 [Plenodomus lindquistii]|nr:hypothetical protein NX059_003695 [Plenodomus lindquistii]